MPRVGILNSGWGNGGSRMLFSGFVGRKAARSIGKKSTAGVLRLRVASAVARDKSVRRSAQDDDSVGVLTKNIQSELASRASAQARV